MLWESGNVCKKSDFTHSYQIIMFSCLKIDFKYKYTLIKVTKLKVQQGPLSKNILCGHIEYIDFK